MSAPERDGRGGLRLPPAIERLRASLVREGDCLVRPASFTRSGHSVMVVDGRRIYAHRLAWEVANGRAVPPGMCICHHCDNPPCCNPDHLFLGTVGDNNRDMWTKGRGVSTPAAWRKVPLTELPEVRRRLMAGESKTSIGTHYGVTRQAIGYLAKREGWL